MSALLNCIEIAPPGAHDASVIWLHGLGATADDFPPVVPHLGLPPGHGVRFVFPQAPEIPVTINGGMVMPAWYDILRMDLEREVDVAGLRRSCASVAGLVERERALGIPSHRIVLAGFSQGGAVALVQGLRHPERLGGIIALSTYLLLARELETERSAANAAVPVFHGHGRYDPVVPYAAGLMSRDRLRALGHEVDWHEYPMQHQVCLEEIEAVGAFLRRILA